MLALGLPRRRIRSYVGAIVLESCLGFAAAGYFLVTLPRPHWSAIIHVFVLGSALLTVFLLLSAPARTFFHRG
ncbi:hypothetical protein [Actinomadura sp. 7K507]|uniref:hypothetical protein n=1 Tax=Actinomadura sp. 7K507 TaxID=2530365 RepID=UPI0010448D2F|nr:hypothetical protein [Actinomadura sp. 7K507]TDC91346.1 hypothetical protein E1285_13170 [Actinomadura sp. 7K507]